MIYAAVTLASSENKIVQRTLTGNEGQFSFTGIAAGKYTLKLVVTGFEPVSQSLLVGGTEPLTVGIELKITRKQQTVTVTADIKEGNVLAPDPAQRVLIRDETLDANPGRPGAPVSIPGLPIETASGGIKAPQYFAPGVAGDHGEPIAQYRQVGSYLVPNNLSANAHGNGYADPNILVPSVIESVQTDGGAFNVREGNHSVNLAATYGLRSQLEPFVTLTGDYRDLDLVAGWSPASGAHSWITLQASYGNGFLDRRSRRNLSDQSGHELDEISPVMQLFVIDWTPACGVGSSFNPKDRASRFHFQRRGDISFSCHCVQLVHGLNQRNTVFAFKKRKDRVNFQVVGDDFLADFQREVGLIEGEGNTIRQAHAMNSDDALALCQRELTRHGCVGSHNCLANHAGRRLAAKSVHILHKSGLANNRYSLQERSHNRAAITPLRTHYRASDLL